MSDDDMNVMKGDISSTQYLQQYFHCINEYIFLYSDITG